MSDSQVRKLAKCALIAVSCFLFFATNVAATTYYVAKNGSDDNPGTESQPWLTIQKAASVMVAGDRALVGPGVYEESVYVSSHSGNPDAPILFKANGEVEFKGNWTVGTYSTPRHYITVDGFHFVASTVIIRGDFNIIKNCIFEGPSGGLGISPHPTADPPSSNVIIENNIFRGFGKVVVMTTGTKSSNILIKNNEWSNIEGDVIRMFGSGNIFRGNMISGVMETGFHADIFQVYDNNSENAYNMLIENNIFKNSTGSLCMIQNRSGKSNISDWTWRNNIIWNVSGVGQISTPYFKFYNNTFVNSGKNTAGPLLFRYDGENQFSYAHHTIIKNNLFIGCGSHPDGEDNGWYHFTDRPPEDFHDFKADFNLVTKSRAAGYESKKGFFGIEIHGINGEDPKFENIVSGDFQLKEGSPAIDSGDTIVGFSTDMQGTVRPQGDKWDRGAFERKVQTQSIIPPLPANLRIVLR